MEITVTKEAQAWFEREMGVSPQRGVRFFGKVYGCSPINDGFSLAIEVNEPSHPIAQTVANGIVYYIERDDAWFFNRHHLRVSYDAELDEPIYQYERLDGTASNTVGSCAPPAS